MKRNMVTPHSMTGVNRRHSYEEEAVLCEERNKIYNSLYIYMLIASSSLSLLSALSV
jgi:hypothetical protein